MPVFCVERQEVFNSLGRVRKLLGIHPDAVLRSIASGEPVKGLTWRRHVGPVSYLVGNERAVVCDETSEVFPSITAAARSIGKTKQAILRSIKEGMSVSGLHFKYKDDQAPMIAAPSDVVESQAA